MKTKTLIDRFDDDYAILFLKEGNQPVDVLKKSLHRGFKRRRLAGC
jgi:hypothetical protein